MSDDKNKWGVPNRTTISVDGDQKKLGIFVENKQPLIFYQPPLYRCPRGHEQRGKCLFVGQGHGPPGGWETTAFCFQCYAEWVATAFPTMLVP